ncbi:MAG: sensor histidine kinase [Flavobacterium sp.]|nr:sensor histidine kinase [Pseudozobellia sp.]MBF01113.1 sensor histidine kinase [Flavobacterium sp.]MBG49044.1 sensor histidine kinase [Pseudozobellia sp.]
MQSRITYIKCFPLTPFWCSVRFNIFLLFFFSIALSSAQTATIDFKETIDSLIAAKPKSLVEMESVMELFDQDTLQLDYFLKSAAKKNFREGQVMALNKLAIRYRQLSKFNLALERQKEALGMASALENVELEVYTLNMLGVLYRRIDAITAALDHTYLAIEKAQAVKNPSIALQQSINLSFNNIGQINRILGQYDLAIEQFKKAMELEKELDNKLGLAVNYQNIGECLEAQGRLVDALEAYDKAMEINLVLNNPRGKILCENGIAHVYVHQGKALEAKEMLTKSLEDANNLGEHALIAAVELTLGWAYAEMENFDEAENHLRQGLEMASAYNFLRLRSDAYDLLSDLWAKKGDYQKALKYFKTSLSVEAQTKNDKNVRYVYSSIIKKDNEERVSSINQQLRKNNTRLLVSGIVLALLSGIFYILYRQYQLKNDKKLLTLEQSMLRSQMNPHFLFNSLNSIKLYIINNEQKNAVHYLNKFSKLVRKILESSSMREIPLAEELETVELYMNIENIRFSNEIDFQIRVDENIDTHTVRIPSLILQPFLENALWHGLSSKLGEKKIDLHITKNVKDFIDISITDNGIGRQAAEKIKENKVLKRKSVGIEITKERLANFSKDYLNTFEVEMVDLYDDEGNSMGTRVILHIPTA